MTQGTYSKKELAKHLAEEHKITTISTYLREIVYGGNDGIVTTFAVVAGFAGAQGGSSSLAGTASFVTVLLFGLANLFADGASMGLGNLLSIRSAQDVYRAEKAKEMNEIKHNSALEKAETVEILIERGYNRKDAEDLTALYMKNPDYWLQFMMDQELQMANPEGENALYTGLATFISFIIFGSIPLIPYVAWGNNPNLFFSSCASTFLALALLGFLRWRVTKESLLRSVGEIVLVGGVAATIAYCIGTLFRV